MMTASVDDDLSDTGSSKNRECSGLNWRHAAWRCRMTRCGSSCGARGCALRKTPFALEQARVDIARRRQRWRSFQAALDPRRLVFIDETWIKANMAPLRGWGAKGQRLRGFAPHGHWRTLTFLGACATTGWRLLVLIPDNRPTGVAGTTFSAPNDLHLRDG